MTKLSKVVKEKRKALQLTQQDLSPKSGLGLRLVREIEQGKSSMRMDKVNQLLDLFGWSSCCTQTRRFESAA